MSKINASDVKPIMQLIGSRKKHAFLHVTDKVTLSGTYWDGGSRSEYYAVQLATMQKLAAPHYDPPQFGGPTKSPQVEIPKGVIIVESGIFCGKPATPVIYVRPDDLALFLPSHVNPK